MTKFHDKLKDVFENLKAFDPKAIKFAIYGEIEINWRTRVLHFEPGTIGFHSFTPAVGR